MNGGVNEKAPFISQPPGAAVRFLRVRDMGTSPPQPSPPLRGGEREGFGGGAATKMPLLMEFGAGNQSGGRRTSAGMGARHSSASVLEKKARVGLRDARIIPACPAAAR
jgi:hypothetical protein